MIILISILPIFATGALASHCGQRQQQRRATNTTSVKIFSWITVLQDKRANFWVLSLNSCKNGSVQHYQMKFGLQFLQQY
jgi:hypothetical protein